MPGPTFPADAPCPSSLPAALFPDLRTRTASTPRRHPVASVHSLPARTPSVHWSPANPNLRCHRCAMATRATEPAAAVSAAGPPAPLSLIVHSKQSAADAMAPPPADGGGCGGVPAFDDGERSTAARCG